jgi:O-methyltransferase/aklanonic acid methyltransferase
MPSCHDAVVSEPASAEVAAVFERAAMVYDTAIPFFSRFGRRLVQLAEVEAGESVLDVASGRGASLIPAAEAVGRGGRVVGVDLAPAMVELLRCEIESARLAQALVTVGDAARLEFRSDDFDVVLCGFTLMLLPDPLRAASECARVLRPGGRIAVSMPTGAGPDWSFLGDLLATFASRTVRPLPQPPQGVDLAEVLRTTGFVDIRSVDEVENFLFADADECWRWLWSQGMRVFLEALPDDALTDLRRSLERRLERITNPDGTIPLPQSARYVTARKPATA